MHLLWNSAHPAPVLHSHRVLWRAQIRLEKPAHLQKDSLPRWWRKGCYHLCLHPTSLESSPYCSHWVDGQKEQLRKCILIFISGPRALTEHSRDKSSRVRKGRKITIKHAKSKKMVTTNPGTALWFVLKTFISALNKWKTCLHGINAKKQAFSSGSMTSDSKTASMTL